MISSAFLEFSIYEHWTGVILIFNFSQNRKNGIRILKQSIKQGIRPHYCFIRISKYCVNVELNEFFSVKLPEVTLLVLIIWNTILMENDCNYFGFGSLQSFNDSEYFFLLNGYFHTYNDAISTIYSSMMFF